MNEKRKQALNTIMLTVGIFLVLLLMTVLTAGFDLAVLKDAQTYIMASLTTIISLVVRVVFMNDTIFNKSQEKVNVELDISLLGARSDIEKEGLVENLDLFCQVSTDKNKLQEYVNHLRTYNDKNGLSDKEDVLKKIRENRVAIKSIQNGTFNMEKIDVELEYQKITVGKLFSGTITGKFTDNLVYNIKTNNIKKGLLLSLVSFGVGVIIKTITSDGFDMAGIIQFLSYAFSVGVTGILTIINTGVDWDTNVMPRKYNRLGHMRDFWTNKNKYKIVEPEIETVEEVIETA